MVPANAFAKMLDAPGAPIPDAFIGDVPKWVPESEVDSLTQNFDVGAKAKELMENPVIQRIVHNAIATL